MEVEAVTQCLPRSPRWSRLGRIRPSLATRGYGSAFTASGFGGHHHLGSGFGLLEVLKRSGAHGRWGIERLPG